MNKTNLLTKLLLLCLCVVGSVNAWAADTEYVIFNGTGSTMPSSSRQADATTGFAYTCANFKGSFTVVSSYTNHGSYVNAIRYGGGTTSSKNHVKLEVPKGYSITIDLVYGGTSTNTKWGISTDGTKPSGSNCSEWNATATASTTLYTASIDLDGDETYYIGGSGDGCVIAYLKVTLKPACTDVAAPTGLSCTDQTKSSLTFGWTKATNASGYTATLYSDAECTSSVSSLVLGDVNTVTFSTLSGSTTYYCKVQSNGNGTTYCEEGGVTDAVNGETDGKDYTFTVVPNNVEYGSVSPTSGSLDKDETVEITATPKTDYKLDYWSVSGTGASLTSTTASPTTLTMGTADVTVTANFRELYTYDISYAAGTGDITGSKDPETKTEDEAFTLPSTAVFSRTGYVQTGWATEDGGTKEYELGGSYTTNADQTFYPVWTKNYTLTYDANGGSGSMSDSEGVGSITLTANAYTKSGYTFIGWATSKDNADAGTVAYADKAAYPLSADATIYAVWAENYIYLLPATSGDAPAENDAINMQSGSFGGSMKALSANLSYTSDGLQFGTNSSTKASVTLNDNLKAGSVITIKIKAMGTSARGLHLYNAAGSSKVTTLGWSSTVESGAEGIFQYTVTGSDALHGTNGFQLWRNNTVILEYLTVTDCQPGGTISASGWNSYSSNKKLDLSTLAASEGDITAYYASSTGTGTVIMKPATGIVDAGEGLMIKGTTDATFTVNAATGEDVTFDGSNLLVGLPNGGTVAKSTDGSYNYVFGWKAADVANTYGFYYLNSNDATLDAGKAYLHLTSAIPTGGRLNIVFDDEETTGIKAIDNEQLTIDNYFDLQGRKVAQPQKGLYIVNGRKVVIK